MPTYVPYVFPGACPAVLALLPVPCVALITNPGASVPPPWMPAGDPPLVSHSGVSGDVEEAGGAERCRGSGPNHKICERVPQNISSGLTRRLRENVPPRAHPGLCVLPRLRITVQRGSAVLVPGYAGRPWAPVRRTSTFSILLCLLCLADRARCTPRAPRTALLPP